MKTLEQIFDILEENNITIDKYEENNTLCGYELNTYTEGGVNQIMFLDFRDKGNPQQTDDFIDKFSEYVESIDIDDEIDSNRQDKNYRANFSIRESVEDFENWKSKLEEIETLIKN